MNKKQELGIYIHIPFCAKKCYYCDFVSYPNMKEKQKEYVEALKKEIKSYDLQNYNITTIYIGGGTPSYIESKYIVEVLEYIKSKLNANETKFENMEITIEVNPGTVTKEKLLDYKKVGINRLSIGLQSTNDRLLKQIGRIHKYQDFLQTYNLARNVGFTNINIDLMLGLPNQSIKDLKESIEKVISLQPEHVSIYSLIVEEGTKLYKQIETGELQLPEEELERKMYWYTKSKLELAGYKHYEISNYAKPKRESKHNSNCWEQKQYIGIGASAHSYLDNIRYCNVSNLKEYISNMENVEADFEEKYIVNERQNLEDRKNEFMLLGLRKIDGVSIAMFKEKYVENPIFRYRDSLEKLVNEGLVLIDGDMIKLTNKGLDLANIVWEEFI